MNVDVQVLDNHGNPVSVVIAAGVALFNSIVNFFASNPAVAAPGIHPAFAEPHLQPPSLDPIRQL